MNGNERLTLECRICGSTEPPPQKMVEGFGLIAYDDMLEWSDFVDHVPPIEEKHWIRSDIAPSVGALRIVNVQFPFNFDIGDDFWVLYRPALSCVNGWDILFFPEVELSAMTKVRFMRTLSSSQCYAWIEVLVEDVIFAGEMCDRFPARTNVDKGQWPCWEKFPRCPEYTYKDFSLYSWEEQQDVGGWYVTHMDASRTEHVIMFSEWFFDYNNVCCGNVV